MFIINFQAVGSVSNIFGGAQPPVTQPPLAVKPNITNNTNITNWF
jgi:hypothetical protein